MKLTIAKNAIRGMWKGAVSRGTKPPSHEQISASLRRLDRDLKATGLDSKY